MGNTNRKKYDARFRPLIRRHLSPQQQSQLEVREAWDDMFRASRGKRILQRLNTRYGSPPTGYITPTTFGGLEATGPPRLGRQPTIKRSTTSKILDSNQMKRIRRHVSPPLPDRQLTPIVPIRHRNTLEKQIRSVLEVGPNTPLDSKYNWKFPAMTITRSGTPGPQASFLPRAAPPLFGGHQQSSLRQMSRGLSTPNRARPMFTG